MIGFYIKSPPGGEGGRGCSGAVIQGGAKDRGFAPDFKDRQDACRGGVSRLRPLLDPDRHLGAILDGLFQAGANGGSPLRGKRKNPKYPELCPDEKLGKSKKPGFSSCESETRKL
jgi:hypothetical protein